MFPGWDEQMFVSEFDIEATEKQISHSFIAPEASALVFFGVFSEWFLIVLSSKFTSTVSGSLADAFWGKDALW